MVSVQRSIGIGVPVHTLYEHLTQFEMYPQFMQDIESVEQRDDTHLHWKARMMDQPIEWDARITERVPDQCIAWQSESGTGNAGKVELQAVGPDSTRLTFTFVSEMEIEATTPAGDIKAELSERIWEDLARLRTMVEAQGQDSQSGQQDMPPAGVSNYFEKEFSGQETGVVAETGIAQGTRQVGNTAGRDGTAQQVSEYMQRDRGSPGNPVPSSGFAAGSAVSFGTEDSGAPATSTSSPSRQRDELMGLSSGITNMNATEMNRSQQDNSLSQGADDSNDERQLIAEEVSFDQQSDFARHVGQLSTDDANETNLGIPNAEVISKAAQRRRPEPEF